MTAAAAMSSTSAPRDRSATGFGLSALIVARWSLILEPVEIVPCVVLLMAPALAGLARAAYDF